MFKTLKRPKSDYKNLFALMLPIILQNLATSSLGLADTLMVGVLGQNELAGLAQANVVFFVIQLFTFGIQSGCAVLISQYWGKRDIKTINRVMGMGFYTSLIFTVAVSSVICFFPKAVMSLTTNDPDIIVCAARYGKTVAYSFVLNSITMVYLGAQRSAENPRLGMTVLTSSMLVNIFLNWVLIFGKFGAPAMGLEGAATATFISRIVEIAMVLFYIIFIDKRLPLDLKKLLVPGRVICADYIKYATPVVINETLWGFGYSMYSVIFGHMAGASDIVAAYSITGNVERIILVFCQATATASAVMIGKSIGRGDKKPEVLSLGNWLLEMSVVCGLFSALLVTAVNAFLMDSVVFRIFTVTPEAEKIALMMMVVMAVRIVFKSYNTTFIVGVLRGGGNVKLGMIIDVVFMYLYSIPAACLAAFVFNAPISVVFIIVSSEDMIKAFVGAYILRDGSWVRDITRNIE